MKKLFSKSYIRYSLFAIGGLLLGWIVFHDKSDKKEAHAHSEEETSETIWTCSMHPQIKMKEFGLCPLCAMDLIPLIPGGTSSDSMAVHFTEEAAALANVQTTIVTKQNPVREIRLYGKVQTDERLKQSQTSHISGRIEKLMVNFTGESVRVGQTLALIYSPELITAQQELLEAAKDKTLQPEIYQAAKDRLKQWKLTDKQINGIESSGKVKENIEVVSNTSGVITAKRVNNGDYVNQGTALFDVADLSGLWVLFDAYETDLPFLKKGDKINYTLQAVPGIIYSANILFIDPVIDPVTRVAKVRIEVSNKYGNLKPEMFATGIVKANLKGYSDKLVIPGSAVLWTGKRSVVYVKQADQDEPVFLLREVELGPSLGETYIILRGLEEGEEIVTQGAFSVDAAAQLEGKPNMLNQNEKTPKTNQSDGEMSGMKM